MSELEIYQKFIEWLEKTWWGLPDSVYLMPLIQSRYTVEDAEFLISIWNSKNCYINSMSEN